MSRQGRVILDGDEREALHTIAFPAKRGRIGRWHNLGQAMNVVSNRLRATQRCRAAVIAVAVVVAAAAAWFWYSRGEAPKPRGAGAVAVVSAVVAAADVPVRLSANASVTALESVDVRAQITATVKAVHIKEGQSVRRGDRLFSLDVRTEDANLGEAEAQVAKSRADLANAERNLQRQHELFKQNFISQTALDTVQNQVDSLRAQLAAAMAAAESSRVARGFGDIVAPIAGRTGAVAVYPGSLVQASGPPLVGISRIDPINVSFTLPERELGALQAAFATGPVTVTAHFDSPGQPALEGRLSFIDNSVDSASGTIRVKARFANPDGRLWPGMFVKVSLSPRTLGGALTVPAQAVQTGPEQKFLYAIGEDGKAKAVPVRVLLVQDGTALVEGAGVVAGMRVVLEGAQNLRPDSEVTEGGKETGNEPGQAKQKKDKS
jgi:multidrug efflux system membrane fusion protein